MIAAPPAPLAVGTEGAYQGTRFVIRGHVRLVNQDEAAWDEYHLAFDDVFPQDAGWLAHAQGRLMLSFESPLPAGLAAPPFEGLRLNEEVGLMPGLPGLHVIDRGRARVEAVRGEVPAVVVAGAAYAYADLANMSGAFATVDYRTAPPTLFVGREVSYAELGMQEPLPADGAPMLCTECGAAMTVRNPGRSERVTCPQCRAVFDVTAGRPQLAGAQDTASTRPFVSLGSVGRFAGGDLTLLGFLRRSTTDDEGKTWTWEEYLLDDGRGGYRWLASSDHHWTLSELVTVGSEVKPVVSYRGRDYKLFQQGPARIDYLEGEFYWDVNAGQTTDVAEFVSPPNLLAVEFYRDGDAQGEAAWTHGVYLPVHEVERAFGVRGLPRPATVGPCQPFRHMGVYAVWAAACVLATLAYAVLASAIRPETVFQKRYAVLPPGPEQVEKDVINVDPGRNIIVTVRSDLQGTWLHLTGNLVDEDTLEVQPFEVPLEHYSGVEDGQPWAEGRTEESVSLSALPGGRYVLAIHVERDPALANPAAAAPGAATPSAHWFEVRVEQGRVRLMHLLVALGLLSVVPLVTGIWHLSFNGRRWENSNAAAGAA